MYIEEFKKKSLVTFSKNSNTNQPIFSQAKSVPYVLFVFPSKILVFV